MGYRSMQGKEVDMGKLMRQNELTPAIGNMKINARGDELGQGGKIIRKREDVVQEYYEGHPESKPTPKVEVPKQPVVTAPVASSVVKKTKGDE
jgi:hypothetical protein